VPAILSFHNAVRATGLRANARHRPPAALRATSLRARRRPRRARRTSTPAPKSSPTAASISTRPCAAARWPGASGSAEARIFTTRFEAELVSIAGVYRTFESGIPDKLAGRPVQIRLSGSADDASSSLLIESLSTN
jgi:hypothetical protein